MMIPRQNTPRPCKTRKKPLTRAPRWQVYRKVRRRRRTHPKIEGRTKIGVAGFEVHDWARVGGGATKARPKVSSDSEAGPGRCMGLSYSAHRRTDGPMSVSAPLPASLGASPSSVHHPHPGPAWRPIRWFMSWRPRTKGHAPIDRVGLLSIDKQMNPQPTS